MGRHSDTRWPRAESPYACGPCREGDHARCVWTVWYDKDQVPCECYEKAVHDHLLVTTDIERPSGLLRKMARAAHNGAPDPWQEFYDRGAAPLLDELADRLARLGVVRWEDVDIW